MSIIKNLISGNDIEFIDNLLEFAKAYETHLTFDELNDADLRKDVWDSIFKRLQQAKYFTIHERCLEVLRILSRDKKDLDDLITEDRLNIIIKNAGLASIANIQSKGFTRVTTEALKLLCNLLYNSTNVQQRIGQTPCLSCIVKRIDSYNESVCHDIKLFDIRVLFLATALNTPLRHTVKNEMHGDIPLINMLDSLSNIFESKESLLTKNDIALACEILKVLFNLYINSDDCNSQETDKHKHLVFISYKFLINEEFHNFGREDELQSNIINLLTVIPYSCYNSIIQPSRGIEGEITYQDMDMTAVARLLHFLDQRLDLTTDLVENISPVISAIARLVKSERLIRKYVRLQVLPPLKDVMKRPEEGSTLRAKLCKLLTSPLTELSDLVAELIFVLCKENVSRMVKYTGYGNAAGMFANKGLLGRTQTANTAAYSSESEDSDTDEYRKYKENINPVTGCYEPPKPNPLEGMSDEQKEYEAMKLVRLVDQLTRQGVVQPCRIGEDGKPKPIEHILELQEELPKLNINNHDNK